MMNPTLPDDDPSIIYNDSDYPSADHGLFPENLDPVTELQGVATDVGRYLELTADVSGKILEVGCGSGRVAIRLARAGRHVTAIDISAGMLDRFRRKLDAEPAELTSRITLVHADAATLDLPSRDFAMALLPFNTLPCIPDFELQRTVLMRIAQHLLPAGRLIIDLISPHRLNPAGDPTPRPFFTRRNVWTGNAYTRFAMLGPMDAQQCQELKGWYDEIRNDGLLERRHYSIIWRPLYRYEAVLMLEGAGFEIESIEGGHEGQPFDATSPKMFIRAKLKSPVKCG